MQAAASHNSSIKLNFGDNAHKGAPTPFHLSLNLDLFSAEECSIRKSLQERLKIELPTTAAVLQLCVKGNSKETAQKLNNSETVKNINETSPSQMNYYALDNKLYVVIKTFFEVEEYFPIVKPQNADEIGQIQLNISSHNDLGKISQLLLEKGFFGLLDSLQAGFEFTKTKIIEEIIVKILDLLGFNGTEKLVKSFKRVNFELNGASSSLFNEFPKVVLKPVSKKPKTEISGILTEANISQAKFYLLNKTFFLKGKFEVDGLAKLIEVLYN